MLSPIILHWAFIHLCSRCQIPQSFRQTQVCVKHLSFYFLFIIFFYFPILNFHDRNMFYSPAFPTNSLCQCFLKEISNHFNSTYTLHARVPHIRLMWAHAIFIWCLESFSCSLNSKQLINHSPVYSNIQNILWDFGID